MNESSEFVCVVAIIAAAWVMVTFLETVSKIWKR